MRQEKVLRSGLMCLLLLAYSIVGLAQTKVVVVPLSGDDLKPLQNIITVAKSNGDFDDPVAALNSITDASAANPYLVVIAPGVYDIGSSGLVMQEYVDVAGSGQDSTFIKGSKSNSSLNGNAALVTGSDNAGLRDLTIENMSSTSVYAVGIYNSAASPKLSNLTIKLADNTQRQYGVSNISSSAPEIDNVTIVLSVSSGGDRQYGIYNNGSSPLIRNTTITTNGGGIQRGIDSFNSLNMVASALSITLSGTTFRQEGINLSGTSSAVISDCTIIVTDTGSLKSAVRAATTTSSAVIRGCFLSSDDHSIQTESGTSGANTTLVFNSILEGTPEGNPICVNSYNVSKQALLGSCDLAL